MNGELESNLLQDDNGVLQYLRFKLPDWHVRLRQVESCTKSTMLQVQEMHTALLGTTDGQKRGILRRLEVIEAWRSTINWILGVMFVAVVGVGFGLAAKVIVK